MPRRTPTIRNGVLEDALERRAGGDTPAAPLVVESPAWFSWLATHAGFRFESPAGTFTARREPRGGGWYWYAARRRHGTLHRSYLGKAEDLTLARLTAAAAALAVPEPATAPLAGDHTPPSAVWPSGTVTFLLTDLESSTSLWEQYPQAMPAALARHNAILRNCIATRGGVVVKTVGDGLHAAFARAADALAAAVAAQRALAAEAWATTGLLASGANAESPLRVRMALHTGAVEARDDDYFGPTLNRLARLLAAGYGGQVLLSQATAALVGDALAVGVSMRDLGVHQLKDLSRPERIFQLVSPDLPADFPPLRTADRHPAPANVHSAPILSTKLAVPRLRAPLVARARLLRQLDTGLSHKLTLLSAPAGFGKTTLVAAWLAKQHDQPEFPPVAWVALDGGDNDPVRFWRYMLTACQAFDADIGQSALTLLQTTQPPLEAMLTEFINALAQLSRGGVLILEDYHVLTAPQLHETLAFFLEHLPATLHVIMLTRSDPPLPIARLRARNEIVELRAADLRFTAEETQSFLQQVSSIPLRPDLVAHLAGRTEGWVAGLRLLALALAGQDDQGQATHYLATFSGSHRPILEYLVADVFSAQPAHLKRFLLLTSILDRLCGPLCDAVLGLGDPGSGVRPTELTPDSYSQLILDQLVRANLFLIPLDDVGQWYRYHALFAEAMQQYARQQLGEDRLWEVAQRASPD